MSRPKRIEAMLVPLLLIVVFGMILLGLMGIPVELWQTIGFVWMVTAAILSAMFVGGVFLAVDFVFMRGVRAVVFAVVPGSWAGPLQQVLAASSVLGLVGFAVGGLWAANTFVPEFPPNASFVELLWYIYYTSVSNIVTLCLATFLPFSIFALGFDVSWFGSD